jgi:GTPase SAR1 family protein
LLYTYVLIHRFDQYSTVAWVNEASVQLDLWDTPGDEDYDRLHRPFNLKGEGGGYGFLFCSEFCFRTTRELEFFFQNITLGYMTKTLNQIICYFLSATLGIRIFSKKNPYPPPCFNQYSTVAWVNEASVQLDLWDTPGDEDYDRLRPLTYPLTVRLILLFYQIYYVGSVHMYPMSDT